MACGHLRMLRLNSNPGAGHSMVYEPISVLSQVLWNGGDNMNNRCGQYAVKPFCPTLNSY